MRFLRDRGIETFGVDPVPLENDMRPYVYPRLEDLPQKRFDVITAFEVFEHLARPCDKLSQLLTFLNENGFIFITTTLTNRALTNLRCFEYWIYERDLTHVGFFHERTFEWLAARHNLYVHFFHYCFIVLDRSSERLIDVEDNQFVFRNQKHSLVIDRPAEFS